MKKQYVEQVRKFNREYAKVLGRIDQEIYNQPFSLTEARVITEIRTMGECTATEIRDDLGIDRGYMSRMIQRLEEENIILKKQATEDKRQFLLYLTEYGKKVYSELVEQANQGVESMLHTIPDRNLSRLTESMKTIESILLKRETHQPEVIIRPYQAGDIGYIAHLHGKLYKNTYNFGPLFEYYVMKGLSEFMMDHEGGELWVAEVDGEVAGSIAITRFDEKTAQLRWFVLDESYHGLGIGKKLMETAIQFSKDQEYQSIFLWTVNILNAARHLYGKYGFVLTEEKENDQWTGSRLTEERWDVELS